jgi:putative hydrolase of the HAD superfamily
VIKALIFDFDGLILDTEAPHYEVWKRRYRARGSDLPLEKWMRLVGGGLKSERFDPCEEIRALPGPPIEDCLWPDFRNDEEYLALVADQSLLPGVRELVSSARAAGIALAVASSSPSSWVEGHLRTHSLLSEFDAVRTREDVENVKPFPDLFVAARDALGVSSDEAVIFEDSLNGVKAGRAAGIFTIAVPNSITMHTDLSSANLVVSSLTELTLESIAAHVKNGHKD